MSNRSILPVLCLMLLTLISCSQRESSSDIQSAAVKEEEPVTRADVRDLRNSLPGKPMHQVLAILGQPTEVFTLDPQRETWGYRDVVKDSVTGRDVKFLEVLFSDHKAQSVSFSY